MHRRRKRFPLSATRGRKSTFLTSDDCGELIQYIKDTLNLYIVPEPLEDYSGLRISVCYEGEDGGIANLPIEWPLPSKRFKNKRESRLWTSYKIIATVMIFENEHVAEGSDVEILMFDIPEDVAKVREEWRRKYALGYDKFLERLDRERLAIGDRLPLSGSETIH